MDEHQTMINNVAADALTRCPLKSVAHERQDRKYANIRGYRLLEIFSFTVIEATHNGE